MNRIARIGNRLGIVAFAGVLAFGCESSDSNGGTGGQTPASASGGSTAVSGSGGSTAVTGSGGSIASAGSGGRAATSSGGSTVSGSGGAVAATGGAGGSNPAATGGSTGAGGMSVPLAACLTAPKNKDVCNSATDMACTNTCGPNKAGFKNCTCNSNVWDCPRCEYLSTGSYSCYKLPATETACPADATDPTGMMLPQSNGVCTATMCTPCGSATKSSYRDSANALKVGYCVCVPGTSATSQAKWSCASVAEWPPQL